MNAARVEVVEVAGTPVHAELRGPAGSPAVVFVHGAMLDHTSWGPQVEALAVTHRVVSWDLPGHGRSKPLGAYGPSTGGEALLAVLDRFGIERAALVGLSVGGWIAQWVAKRHPERVSGLACFDTTSLTEPTLPGIARWGLRHSAAITALLPFSLVRWIVPPVLARTPAARRHARAAASRVSRQDFLRFWRGASRMLEPDPDHRHPAPLLIAHGAHDPVARIPVYARRWADRCPHARLEVLPGAGHLANLDAPEATTAILRGFLDRISEGVGSAQSAPEGGGDRRAAPERR